MTTPVEPPDLPFTLNDLMALTDKVFPDWEDLERFWDRSPMSEEAGSSIRAASFFAIPGPPCVEWFTF